MTPPATFSLVPHKPLPPHTHTCSLASSRASRAARPRACSRSDASLNATPRSNSATQRITCKEGREAAINTGEISEWQSRVVTEQVPHGLATKIGPGRVSGRDSLFLLLLSVEHIVWTYLAVKCGPHQLGMHPQQSEEDEVGQDGGVQQIYRSVGGEEQTG